MLGVNSCPWSVVWPRSVKDGAGAMEGAQQQSKQPRSCFPPQHRSMNFLEGGLPIGQAATSPARTLKTETASKARTTSRRDSSRSCPDRTKTERTRLRPPDSWIQDALICKKWAKQPILTSQRHPKSHSLPHVALDQPPAAPCTAGQQREDSALFPTASSGVLDRIDRQFTTATK